MKHGNVLKRAKSINFSHFEGINTKKYKSSVDRKMWLYSVLGGFVFFYLTIVSIDEDTGGQSIEALW